jgi:hypothetical protein
MNTITDVTTHIIPRVLPSNQSSLTSWTRLEEDPPRLHGEPSHPSLYTSSNAAP